MSFPNETKVDQLRRLFEGREAIYVEKGALRVKVTDISADLAQRCIFAEVEEIPTIRLSRRQVQCTGASWAVT